MKLKLQFLLVLSLMGYESPLLAKKNNESLTGMNKLEAPFESPELWLTSQSILQSRLSDKSKRSPASTASEELMSNTAKNLRDRFLNAKTAADISALLKEMDEKYPTYHPTTPEDKDNSERDAKFFAARMLPLRALAGITWRMIPIIKKTRMAHEASVGFLRGLFEQISIRFPGEQNTAVFRYLTEPQPESLNQFNSELEMQNEFSQSPSTGANSTANHGGLYSTIILAMTRLQSVDLSEPIVMDGKLRFGIDAFADGEHNEDRFHFVGEAEKSLILARMHRRLSALASFLAYDFNGFVYYRQEIGRKLGFDVINITTPIAGLTREGRVKTFKSGSFRAKYPNLFKLRTEKTVEHSGYCDSSMKGKKISVGQAWMNMSYCHLHANVAHTTNAWNILSANSNSDRFVIEREMFTSRKEEINSAIENMKGLVPDPSAEAKPFPLYSYSLKAPVVVNLKQFYYEAPQKLDDLLPTDFDGGNPQANRDGWITEMVGGKKVTYRDYTKGRALGWSKEVYSKLYPNITSGNQVDDYQRTLIESRGGRLVSMALFSFVR